MDTEAEEVSARSREKTRAGWRTRVGAGQSNGSCAGGELTRKFGFCREMVPESSTFSGRDVRPDKLFELQLAIARKADQLTLARASGPGLNLHCWLLAEAELLGGAVSDTLEPPAPKSSAKVAVGP